MEENKNFGNSEYLPFYIKQIELSKKVVRSGPLDFKHVAGVDVAYDDKNDKLICSAVLFDNKTKEKIDEVIIHDDVSFPYIPGLFSFREVPPAKKAIDKLSIKPDLIICDAHGIAHPKKIGMASHLGIELDIATIGCAKNWLAGEYDKSKLGQTRGSFQNLILGNDIVGVALRTQNNVNPIFVSIGHKISLEDSIKMVLKYCTEFRLPETTRCADQNVRKYLNK